MISESELWSLKDERKVLIASRDEAKWDYIESKKRLDKMKDKNGLRKLVDEVRIKQQIYWWFDYQVKEITGRINAAYKEVWNTPKPKTNVQRKGKKKKKK